jgi:hypothetical protein
VDTVRLSTDSVDAVVSLKRNNPLADPFTVYSVFDEAVEATSRFAFC